MPDASASQPIRAVTVYCSSSTRVERAYHDAAALLGQSIAAQGWSLVYGGNCLGCMDALASAARAQKGKVIGITPRSLTDEGVVDRQADELIVTDSMRQRKELLEQRGDAAIALPGGFGTLEEVFEYVVGRQLGYHDKPMVLLNIQRYWDPLLDFIARGAEAGFIRPKALRLYHVAQDVPEAIEWLSGNRSHRQLTAGN